MYRNLPKPLVLLFAILMAAGLVACQGAAPAATTTAAPAATTAAATTAAATTAAAAATTTEAASGSDDMPFVKITHYATGDPNPNGMLEKVQEEWNKLLREELNCELEQMWIVWADYLTKYNLLLASGDTSIDLFEASSTWLELWQNADRGAWLKLDDLLPQYAPITWAEVPAEVWDECRFRGDIVCIPENDYTQYVNHGFIYRADWAEEAGLPKQLETIEQFEEYGDWIIANKPGAYPIDCNNTFNFFARWAELNTPTNSILGVNETVRGESLADPYTAVDIVFQDVAVKWAQDMKRWGDKGFWREDVLNNTADIRDSFRAGTSGVDLHHVNTLRGLKWQMETELYPDEAEVNILLFSDLAGRLIQDPINTHGAMCVYAYSQNPERALMVYDFIRNDERMYRLFNWGIEGVNYEIDSEGFRIRPDSWTEAENSFGTNFWGGRVDKFEYPSRQEWSGIYDYWKVLDTKVVPDPYSQFVFDKSPVDAELSAMTAVITEVRPAIATGKAGDPVAAIESYRSRLKAAGYDKYYAEVQKQLDEYKIYKEGN
ncbi:MAG: ABC transporter substrate-binding protein [Oscillospiraceae bacterium]|nr:ABC transporter substrate-binding protein [Oscillospiraceae bacterium]